MNNLRAFLCRWSFASLLTSHCLSYSPWFLLCLLYSVYPIPPHLCFIHCIHSLSFPPRPSILYLTYYLSYYSLLIITCLYSPCLFFIHRSLSLIPYLLSPYFLSLIHHFLLFIHYSLFTICHSPTLFLIDLL